MTTRSRDPEARPGQDPIAGSVDLPRSARSASCPALRDADAHAPAPSAPAFVAAATFEELIGHLDDLIALGRFEGFGLFSAEMSRARGLIVAHRAIFDPAPAARAAAAAEFAGLTDAKGRP